MKPKKKTGKGMLVVMLMGGILLMLFGVNAFFRSRSGVDLFSLFAGTFLAGASLYKLVTYSGKK